MDMVKVGEENGIHFPREFALLLKQFLYFDRYVHILAPELDMFIDDRLNMLHWANIELVNNFFLNNPPFYLPLKTMSVGNKVNRHWVFKV